MTSCLFHLKQPQVNFGSYSVINIPELKLQKDKITAIIGPNGAGKSTLLKALIGYYPSEALLCLGQSASKMLKQGHIAWVGQHESASTPLSLKAYVLLGCYPHLGWFSQPSSKDLQRMSDLLAAFELSHLMENRLDTLSGGEKQRAALVRALMQRTQIILLDEPNNHLDIKHQHQLMRYLLELKQAGMSVVIVLHDLALAANYCDEVVLMNKGQILAQGQPNQVMTEVALKQAYQWPIRPYQYQGKWYFDSFHP